LQGTITYSIRCPFVISLSTVGQTWQYILQGYLRFQQALKVSNKSLASKSPKESRMQLTELKQLTDYQKFIVLDSGGYIPTDYQKIPYHMVFDVKYDLRHKAKLVSGGNWTVKNKEDIIQELFAWIL
jgi:hypothetical protein